MPKIESKAAAKLRRLKAALKTDSPTYHIQCIQVTDQ